MLYIEVIMAGTAVTPMGLPGVGLLLLMARDVAANGLRGFKQA